jgi:hypothetical protein
MREFAAAFEIWMRWPFRGISPPWVATGFTVLSLAGFALCFGLTASLLGCRRAEPLRVLLCALLGFVLAAGSMAVADIWIADFLPRAFRDAAAPAALAIAWAAVWVPLAARLARCRYLTAFLSGAIGLLGAALCVVALRFAWDAAGGRGREAKWIRGRTRQVEEFLKKD